VFLVGFMGCGKSSFGRRLAGELRRRMVDTDNEIERRAGMTIVEIFERHGEEAFRALESEVIGDVATSDSDVVVALGGGAVCRPGVMERLGEAGETVYLKTPTEKLVRRLSAVGRARRPKIAGMGDAELVAYIEKTLPSREVFYNRANFVLDCAGEEGGGSSDGALVRRLLQHLEKIER
jgi:shikimate kinase